MDAWKLSLRCLQHPFSVIAVGLLLLNDHLLKPALASAFTGKLSDFAGLFFFPFLLAALIAGAAQLFKRRLPAVPVLAASFALTLAAFTLFKTYPAANAWLTRALGGRSITLDPTDLVALLMLIPAGLLARRILRAQAPGTAALPVSRLAYLALGAAALASAATSPCMTSTVERTAVVENAAYLWVPGSYENPQIYRSIDGLKWTAVEGPAPASVDAALGSAPVLPKTICLPRNPRECYRISGSDVIEASSDGGQTWNTAWQIPPGREAYMLRKPPLSCKTRSDITVLDLAVLPVSGSSPLIVGAMGEEGVVVRAADGSWQRLAVGYANPSPYTARDPFTAAWAVVGEMFFLLLFGTVAFWVVNAWGWYRLTRSQGFTSEEIKPARRPPWVVMLLTLAGGITLAVIGSEGRIDGAAWFVIVGMLCVLYAIFLTPFITWGRVRRLYKTHDLPRRAPRRAGWLCAALLLPVPQVLLTFWGMGAIAHYWVALLAALGSGLLILLGAILGIRALPAPETPAKVEGA